MRLKTLKGCSSLHVVLILNEVRVCAPLLHHLVEDGVDRRLVLGVVAQSLVQLHDPGA